MKLVVDANVPAAGAVFGAFGSVLQLPGRAIDAAAVKDADVLIVRSVTRVDAALLTGSRVRFVGSTTAGVDHVDEPALRERGIVFAHAPGSNADSVVDYVLAALALAFDDDAALRARPFGIVGCGQVGMRLLRRLRALGFACRVFDPFIAPLPESAPLAEVLACGVVSLHVPLTQAGPHPTAHLLDGARLRALAADALLINAARGAVIDNRALAAVLAARGDLRVVLDTWEGEPAPDPALLRRCLAGTPHIAGYAQDGKLEGVRRVHAALCAFTGSEPAPAAIAAMRLPAPGTLRIPPGPGPAWLRAVRAAYDLRADAAPLAAAAQPVAVFDRLRRDYPVRREFSAWRVEADALEPAQRALLQAAGFAA